jgi:hypothetical protein
VSIEDEVVRKAPLFTALDDAAALSLRASMDSVKINKGAILFKEANSSLAPQAEMAAKISYQSLAPAKCLVSSHSLIQAHGHQLQLQ